MAQVTRAQKMRLGVFVGIALAALGYALVMLIGQSVLQERDDYLIRFSSRGVSFSGLESGSPVKYSGITIGQVRTIRVAPDDVSIIEVEISVERGTPIAEDSAASLATLGITGLKYVDLSRGSPDARVREPGEEIPAGDSLMDELTARAGSIAETLEDLLKNVKEMLGEDTRDNVNLLLGESAGILEDNRPQIASILENVRIITADLTRISESGVSVAEKLDILMNRIQEIADALYDLLAPDGRMMQMVSQTERLVERLNLVVLRSENDLDIAMRHFRDATANINEFSLVIRDDPRAIIGTSDRGGRGEGRRGEGR